jgi:hypothetical protein
MDIIDYIIKRIDELSFWLAVIAIVLLILLPKDLALFIVTGVILPLVFLPDTRFSKTLRNIMR